MECLGNQFWSWAIGGAWGEVSDDESLRALHAAVDAGVNFIDTADVYGDGRSERLVARLEEGAQGRDHRRNQGGRKLPNRPSRATVARTSSRWSTTACGIWRRIARLLQLHCPPTDLYYHPEVFGILDDLVEAGNCGTTA